MASSIIPNQNRFNDPYQNLIFDYNTVDSKVYLSRESNSILKAIGDNLVLNGLELDPITFAGSVISVDVTAGFAIQDLTLLEILDVSTLDMDVAYLADTTVGGCHLAVFVDYQYIATIEPNIASLQLFHIAADGTVDYPPGIFNSSRDKLLLGIIQFTKSGTNVTAASLLNVGSFTIEGTTFYVRGYDPANMNLSGLISGMISSTTVLQGIKDDLLKYDYLMSE